MTPDTPITDIEIIALAAGELRGDAAERVRQYLRKHADAAALFSWYRLVQDTAYGDDSVPAPPSVIERAKAAFEAPAPGPSLVNRLVTIATELIYDSRTQALAVRDAVSESVVRLTFESSELEISIEAERIDPARWSVIGQVAPADGPCACRVVIVSPDGPVAECTTDARGVFTVDVADGSYELLVDLGAQVASACGIRLG